MGNLIEKASFNLGNFIIIHQCFVRMRFKTRKLRLVSDYQRSHLSDILNFRHHNVFSGMGVAFSIRVWTSLLDVSLLAQVSPQCSCELEIIRMLCCSYNGWEWLLYFLGIFSHKHISSLYKVHTWWILLLPT